MNLSTLLRAIAVIGPDVSPDRTTSRKGDSSRTASSLLTSVQSTFSAISASAQVLY
jgi:hypothetical protein